MPSYYVLLTPLEVALLASLRGRVLNALATDGWAVFLSTKGLQPCFTPEEAHTPDDFHPNGEVVRVQVREDATPLANLKAMACPRAVIESVHIQTVRVTFTSPEVGPAFELVGIDIPEGIDYGLEFLETDTVSEAWPETRCLAQVDVLVRLVVAGQNLCIGTEAIGYFVQTSLTAVGAEATQFPAGTVVERSVGYGADSERR